MTVAPARSSSVRDADGRAPAGAGDDRDLAVECAISERPTRRRVRVQRPER